MAVAHDEATMELIKTRLSHSERPLIRLIRTFYKLSTMATSPPFRPHKVETSEEAAGENEDNGASADALAEEIKIIHMSFLIELNNLIKTLKDFKLSKVIDLCKSELNQLEIERINLEDQASKEKMLIQDLEFQLEQARRDRKNKMLYEEIGKEVRRFSDRFQSADRINGLAREIDSLLEEQGFYAERWASRRAQFDTVILNLEVLQESIKEEKADADRKKALNDDESEDGNIGDEQVDGTSKAAPTNQEDEENNNLEGESQVKNSGASSMLNPNAPAFHISLADPQSSQVSTPDDRMKIDHVPDKATITNEAAQGSAGVRSSSSESIGKPDQSMDIDGVDPVAQSTQGPGRRGTVRDAEAIVEDGEEIEVEEAEEGEEMEGES